MAIRDMKKVYLVYTQKGQRDLVARLQELGNLHLEEAELDDLSLVETESQGQPSPQAQDQSTSQSNNHEVADRRRVENMLIKARGVLDLFSEVDPVLFESTIENSTVIGTVEEVSQEVQEEIEALEGNLKTLVSERRDLRDRQSAGQYLKEIVQESESLIRDLPAIEGDLVAMIGEAKDSAPIVTEILNTLNSQLGGRVALTTKEISDNRFLVIVKTESEYADLIESYMEEKGLRPVGLPPHIETDYLNGIALLKAEESTIPTRLNELDGQLAQLAQQHGNSVFVLTNSLENRMAQLEAGSKFGYTNYTSVITGWVPANEVQEFQMTLMSEFPGIIFQEDTSKVESNEIPVDLVEPGFAKPYKVFLDAFGTPNHGVIDPVPVISIFFPIFFGMIVGDIGYGLIVMMAVLWGYAGFPGVKKLKKVSKNEGVRGALAIVRDGAIFSILFGFFFGEIFGFEFGVSPGLEWIPHGIHVLGILEWPFSRIHFSIDLLNITVAIGYFVVTLGFVFGAVMAIRHGHTNHLIEKIGLFLALIGFSLVVANLMGLTLWGLNEIPQIFWVGIVTAAIGIVLAARSGGMQAAMESISPFIHVLSFARVMGFALAGAVLAGLINTLFGTISNSGLGIIGVILGAIVAVALHAFNLVLHVFEGSIQSARLHWVEFFGKFILTEFGGKKYEPFKEKDLSDYQ
jgi:V/A-type H+-transporting ATPase subunit I